jgi:hypothetical protein
MNLKREIDKEWNTWNNRIERELTRVWSREWRNRRESKQQNSKLKLLLLSRGLCLNKEKKKLPKP